MMMVLQVKYLSTDGSGVLSWADQPDISGKADTSTVNTALAAKARSLLDLHLLVYQLVLLLL